jgi:hypothetical protein
MKDPIIPAEVHRDDWHFSASFDALLWFQQASDDDIRALAECGWGGDYPADDVARHVSDTNADVERVLDNTTCEEGMGFECHVNETMARAWLKEHKLALHDELWEV